MAGPASIVEYFAEHEAYRCGYCGKSDTNYSHGMWAHAMTVQDYQDLLNRGWRRSGKYCYKPTMNILCCPMYTIRCEALKFKLRKSHKKVLKKVNKYLIEGIKPSGDIADDETEEVEKQSSKKPVKSENQSTKIPSSHCKARECTEEKAVPGCSKDVKSPRKGEGADPSKPPCKKAKDRRKEKKLAKLAAKGESTESVAQDKVEQVENKCEGKTLEEYLAEPSKATSSAHKLEICLVRSSPKSQQFEDSLKETHKVYVRYQMAIHGDPEDKPNMRQFTRFLIDSPLEIKLLRSYPKCEEFKTSYDESYKVYKKYQMAIHKDKEDDCSKSSYDDFLVHSPLEYSLGTYSALVEMALVRELHKHSAEMIYYYMGYYIHSCPKMKYKGQYQPSYLLCPETYTWHPVEKCQAMLDQKTYCRFEEDTKKGDEDGEPDLETLLVLYQRTAMPYTIYQQLSKGKNDDLEEVKEYAGYVGRKLASRLLLFRK
ncbi:arginyl-tRNA--protein transferase 1-like [Ruditapes philippinarum]|uniref:arginyl-tRNA--protein transferase 1-like n=1 Tax=Ruditapes philippinarum TaxID=129788 RepID=UPI00295AA9DD|nr:arginyl-tRNA--protein transferase 1-like [Ruditapes philippinarum]